MARHRKAGSFRKAAMMAAVCLVAGASATAEAVGCAIVAEGRSSYRRGERGAVSRFRLENDGPGAFEDLKVAVRQTNAAGVLVAETSLSRRETLAPGETWLVDAPVETRIRPGTTVLSLSATWREGAHSQTQRVSRTCRIGPTSAAGRMPAVIWGWWSFESPVSEFADFGFTHAVDNKLGFRTLARPEDWRSRTERNMDDALAAGVGLFNYEWHAYPADARPRSAFDRITHDGRPYLVARRVPSPEVSNPAFVPVAREKARTNLGTFGKHPAFCGTQIVSEMRDGSFPSFRTEHSRYERETGRKVPEDVLGIVYAEDLTKAKYPDGVIPDDDPALLYYSWFWRGGDGWPAYIGAIAEEYRKAGFRFNFFDPAVRCPPMWGSGGSVDVLNHWVYAIPEPMCVAGVGEEMFAMAAGRGQKVSLMTQLICYRARMAPTNVVVSPAPKWLSVHPRADLPTVPPDSLQEATWSMLAKPVCAVMFYGWATIREMGRETGHCYTCPETADMMRKLLKGVVAPLGPALMRIGRRPPEVMVLESATTALMGGPKSWGWGSPAVTFMQRARLDPRVIYEDEILRDGFGDGRVLYVPQCRYLTQRTIDRIRAFQADGGILVGDGETIGALKPDITVPLMSFKAPPLSDKAADIKAELASGGDAAQRAATVKVKADMLAAAADLRRRLERRGFRPRTDSSTPEIVTYAREWNGVPYLFAVNDRRTFGDYVGQWGLTMEKGLPAHGTVRMEDRKGEVKAVYELSRGGRVDFVRRDGYVELNASYDTNDGRLYAFLDAPISAVRASAYVEDGTVCVTMNVTDDCGQPVRAVLPGEIRIYDAAGAELDGAGYVAVVDGLASISVPVNVDDAKGAYSIVCRDRASGLTCRLSAGGAGASSLVDVAGRRVADAESLGCGAPVRLRTIDDAVRAAHERPVAVEHDFLMRDAATIPLHDSGVCTVFDWTDGEFGTLNAARDLGAKVVRTTEPDKAIAMLAEMAAREERPVTAGEFRVRDPFILADPATRTYHLYETTCPYSAKPFERGVSVRTSRDLETWSPPRRVMTVPSGWRCRTVWAPEVHIHNGRYWLFTTLSRYADGNGGIEMMARDPSFKMPEINRPGLRGTWIYSSESPLGPFEPVAGESVTPPGWIALDGTLFVDGGRPYMAFCHEWTQTQFGRMAVAPLSGDLSRLAAEPLTIFEAHPDSVGLDCSKVTDGCFCYRSVSGKLFMIWSTGVKGSGYSVVLCESESGRMEGPWIRHHVIFGRNGGHAMIFKTFDGRLKMSLHQPERRGFERLRIFDMVDTGDDLKVVQGGR